jgi:hypothetical protein
LGAKIGAAQKGDGNLGKSQWEWVGMIMDDEQQLT